MNTTLRSGIAALVLMALGAAAQAAESPAAFLAKVNTNGDKTLSLAEVSKYALTRYDALDADHDNKLTMKELGGRLTEVDFEEANTKHSSETPSLSSSEFTVYVAKLFGEANQHLLSGNTNVSGTLSARELATPAGEKLIKLLE